MHSNYRLSLPALCTLALLSGLLPVPAAAEVVTVKEFYGHFGSGEPHRQSITIDLINAVVSETSIAACGGDDREDFIKYPASANTDFTDLGMVAFEGQIGLEDIGQTQIRVPRNTGAEQAEEIVYHQYQVLAFGILQNG